MMSVSKRFRRAFRAVMALVLLMGQSTALAAVTGPRCASLHIGGAASEVVDGSANVSALPVVESDDAPHDHSAPDAVSVSSCTVAAVAAPRSHASYPAGTTLLVVPELTNRPNSATSSPPYHPPRI